MTRVDGFFAEDCGWGYELFRDGGGWVLVAEGFGARAEVRGDAVTLLALFDDGRIGCAWSYAAQRFRPLLTAEGVPA